MRHPRSGKALLKHFATLFSAQLRYSSDRFYRVFQTFNDETGLTRLHKLRDRAAAIGNDRRAAGHCLNHHQPKRLRPVDRKQQRIRIAEEFIFLLVADLAYEFHKRIT
jgi:hypothetical protein